MNWKLLVKQVWKHVNVWQLKSSVTQQLTMLWLRITLLNKWVKKNLKNSLWLMTWNNQCVTGKILNKTLISIKMPCLRLIQLRQRNNWTVKNCHLTISVMLMRLSALSVISKTVQLLWRLNTWTHVVLGKQTTLKQLGIMLTNQTQCQSLVVLSCLTVKWTQQQLRKCTLFSLKLSSHQAIQKKRLKSWQRRRKTCVFFNCHLKRKKRAKWKKNTLVL